MEKGTTLTCGCVIGYYWCYKHDIYVKQDTKNDKRWNNPEDMIDMTKRSNYEKGNLKK